MIIAGKKRTWSNSCKKQPGREGFPYQTKGRSESRKTKDYHFGLFLLTSELMQTIQSSGIENPAAFLALPPEIEACDLTSSRREFSYREAQFQKSMPRRPE
jgi:hypothetical protein